MRKELEKRSKFGTASIAYAYRNEGCPGVKNTGCIFDKASMTPMNLKLFKQATNFGCTLDMSKV